VGGCSSVWGSGHQVQGYQICAERVHKRSPNQIKLFLCWKLDNPADWQQYMGRSKIIPVNDPHKTLRHFCTYNASLFERHSSHSHITSLNIKSFPMETHPFMTLKRRLQLLSLDARKCPVVPSYAIAKKSIHQIHHYASICSHTSNAKMMKACLKDAFSTHSFFMIDCLYPSICPLRKV